MVHVLKSKNKIFDHSECQVVAVFSPSMLTCFLCNIIWSENFLFCHKTCFFEENVSFIYSIITLFWKIAFYLSRLNRAFKWRHCSQKHICLFKFRWKVCKISWYVRCIKVKKKKVNVIIAIIIKYAWNPEYAWICLYKQDSEHVNILNIAKF